jgi:predicted transcriptional regulator
VISSGQLDTLLRVGVQYSVGALALQQALRLCVQCLTNAFVKQPRDGSLTIRLPLPLKAALERTADNERRSLSQTVGLAIEQYLEARGEWPPAGSKQGRSTARRR